MRVLGGADGRPMRAAMLRLRQPTGVRFAGCRTFMLRTSGVGLPACGLLDNPKRIDL